MGESHTGSTKSWASAGNLESYVGLFAGRASAGGGGRLQVIVILPNTGICSHGDALHGSQAQARWLREKSRRSHFGMGCQRRREAPLLARSRREPGQGLRFTRHRVANPRGGGTRTRSAGIAKVCGTPQTLLGRKEGRGFPQFADAARIRLSGDGARSRLGQRRCRSQAEGAFQRLRLR